MKIKYSFSRPRSSGIIAIDLREDDSLRIELVPPQARVVVRGASSVLASLRSEDISAVVALGPYLVIASDEEASIQVLKEVERGRSYATSAPVNLTDKELLKLADEDKIELDLEGIALDGRTLYVIGSHSRVRSQVTRRPATKRGSTPRLRPSSVA